MLVVELNGPEGESRRIHIDGAEATIGRHASNELQLPRANVSRHHARIARRDGVIFVTDLDSTNGTYVNARKVGASTVVREHDTIYIGDYLLVVHSEACVPTIDPPLSPYLARDPIEQRLLTEIATRDDASREVYADWLEQRGDHERAEFLRIQQELVTRTLDEHDFDLRATRLRVLAAGIDLSWRARVARPPVERCQVAFELACPKEWGKLEPTDREGVRSCSACKETVHYAPTVADARRLAAHGNCVAIDIAAYRWTRDLDGPYGHFVCQRCKLDVGPSLSSCPRCGAPMQRQLVMGRMPG